MFYTFRQNNSGGSFDIIPSDGISVNVIIEADSHWQANNKAEEIGLYFDPELEIDCPCCGSRWYSVDDDDGDLVPSINGKPVHDEHAYLGYPWAKGEPEGFIHYADGHMEAIWADQPPVSFLRGEGTSRVTPWPYVVTDAQLIAA